MSGNESVYIGSGFEPWGGLVNCTTKDDCVASAAGNPGHLATCVLFDEKIGELVTDPGTWCVCNIAYTRRGESCSEVAGTSHIWGGLCFVPLILYAATFFYVLKVLYGQRPIQMNAKITTLLTILLASVLGVAWAAIRIALFFGAPQEWYPPNVAFAGISGAGSACVVTMVSLVWQSTLKASKKMKRGSKSGVSTRQVIAVAALSIGLCLTILLLAIKGHTSAASKAIVGYVIGIFFFYIYVGRNMKKTVASSAGTSSDARVAQAISRIQVCIRDVCIFVLWFVICGLIYTKTATDEHSNSLSTVPASAIGLGGMQLSGAWIGWRIALYSAGANTRRKKGVVGVDGTSVNSSATSSSTE